MNSDLAKMVYYGGMTKEAWVGGAFRAGLGLAKGVGKAALGTGKMGWRAAKAVGPTNIAMGSMVAAPFIGGVSDEVKQQAGGLWDSAKQTVFGAPRQQPMQRPRSNGSPIDMLYNMAQDPRFLGAAGGLLGGALGGSALGLPWWAGALAGGGLGYLGGDYYGQNGSLPYFG